MKNYKKFYDIGDRDAPVIFYENILYIGNNLDTHTTLLNKILGLDLQIENIKESLDINFSNKVALPSEFEDKILYGNLYEKTIYWENFSDNETFNLIKKKNKDYRHKLLTYAQHRR